MRRALLLLALLCAAPAAAQAALVSGPYLQSPAPGQVSICAYVDSGEELSVKLIQPDQTERIIIGADDSPTCAALADLAPDMSYSYELLLDNAPLEPPVRGTFAAGASEVATLAILGDTRSGDDSFDLDHRRVVQAVARSVVPDAVLHTGDCVERDDPALWANFLNIESPLLRNAPFFPAIGMSDQPATLMRRSFPVLGERGWYSFDRGAAHFAVLNLWDSGAQNPAEIAPDGAQALWLKQDLAAARAAGAAHLFVVLHDPVIGLDGRSPRALREVYMPLFESFGVSAVFSGAHYFSHALRNNVHYFTNGGGGALLDHTEPKPGVFLFHSAVHHFLVLQIDRLGASITAYNAEGSAFYQTDLGAGLTGGSGPDAANRVATFGSGPRTLALSVFFLPGCDDCASIEAELPGLAEQADATLVVTFRSLNDPDNQALLAAHGAADAPAPVVLVGDQTLAGLEQIQVELPAALSAPSAERSDAQRTPIWMVIITAAIAIALVARYLIRRRQSIN